MDTKMFNHFVVKLTLHNGETYALDLASAQHGFHSPLFPWSIFCKTRIDNFDANGNGIVKTRPFGFLLRAKIDPEACQVAGWPGSLATMNAIFTDTFNDVVNDLEKYKPLKNALVFSDPEFDKWEYIWGALLLQNLRKAKAKLMIASDGEEAIEPSHVQDSGDDMAASGSASDRAKAKRAEAEAKLLKALNPTEGKKILEEKKVAVVQHGVKSKGAQSADEELKAEGSNATKETTTDDEDPKGAGHEEMNEMDDLE